MLTGKISYSEYIKYQVDLDRGDYKAIQDTQNRIKTRNEFFPEFKVNNK